jgi:hypothetical protein
MSNQLEKTRLAPTRPVKKKEKGKLHPQRSSVWKERTKQMRQAGIAIHGDKAGYLADVIYVATNSNSRIGALLEMHIEYSNSQVWFCRSVVGMPVCDSFK